MDSNEQGNIQFFNKGGISAVFENFLAMLPATILMPIMVNRAAGVTIFHISNVLLAAGVGTLLFLAVTKGRLPGYLGSSFAYIGVTCYICQYFQHAPREEILSYIFGAYLFSAAVLLVLGILCHIDEIDTEKNFQSLFTAVNRMAEKYDMPILYSCHPRSRKKLEESGFVLDERVIRQEPLGFHDYNCLQMNAFAVVSDSGTLPEESSFFTCVGHPFPAVCIRTSTERPEALDKACFVLAGIDGDSLLQAVETAVEMNRNGEFGIPVPDYVEENVSTKVVKIIQSYTGVVNKMVWRKF